MDNENLVQGAIPYGYRCQHNKVLYKEIWEAEDIKAALDDDNRTMRVMVDLANTIHQNNVIKGDSPSLHTDKRVPMLALAIYIEDQVHQIKINRETVDVKVQQVCYSFYKKLMASSYILRASTALPERMKYQNAANVLIRMINNTYRGMINYNAFIKTLQISGYN